jgi:hypothetical protein
MPKAENGLDRDHAHALPRSVILAFPYQDWLLWWHFLHKLAHWAAAAPVQSTTWAQPTCSGNSNIRDLEIDQIDNIQFTVQIL